MTGPARAFAPSFTPPDAESETMVYTVDLGNGHVADIEGPKGATPEQLKQAVQASDHPDVPPDASHDLSDMPASPGAPTLVQADKLSETDSAHLTGLYKTGTAHDILSFLESRGRRSDPAKLTAFIRDRDAHHPSAYGISYEGEKAPDSGAGMATVRGAADTLSFGLAPKAMAAAKAATQMSGLDSFGDNYARNLDTNNAYDGMDEENHPWARAAGQLLGGIVLPAGMEGVGLKAGTDVLKAGGTMIAARIAAKIAVRNRMAAIGVGYGAAHGAGSADTLGDAVSGAAIEGTLGAVTGGLIGQAGRVSQAAPARNAAAAAARAGSATAEDAARIAAQYGIRPTPATTGGAMSHAAQMMAGNVPGGMTAVARGVARENDGVASAARDIAGGVGTVSTREGAGQAVVEGAQAYSATSRAEGRALYSTRDRLMGGDAAPVTLDSTQSQIADIARRYPTSQTLAALMQHPVIRRIAGVADDAGQDGLPSELTLAEATDALSHVRGVSRVLARNGADSDQITARVNDVRGALTDDVMRAAAAADQAAGRAPGDAGSAVQAQRRADAFWADRKTALAGTLKAAMTAGAKPTEMPSERVYGQIDTDTLRVGGNLARLRDTWFRLPQDARNTIAATKVDDMGRSLPGQQSNMGDAWSFDRYLTNFDKMSPQARNIMFGPRASDQLADIAAYSSRLRDLSKSRNFSNTAKNLISGAILTTVGSALWHGAPMEAIGAMASIPASYAGAALFLKTPAMRQWTQSALRAAMISNPIRSASAGKGLVVRLTRIARAEPAIANEVMALQRRLTDALSSSSTRLAANERLNGGVGIDGQDGQNNEGQNQQGGTPQ